MQGVSPYITTSPSDFTPTSKFLKMSYDSNGQKCTAYLAGLTDWQGGENHAITTVKFTAPFNDGTYDYAAGDQVFDYAVYVKP